MFFERVANWSPFFGGPVDWIQPLSTTKTTSRFLPSPRLSRPASSSPTVSSIHSHMAQYFASRGSRPSLVYFLSSRSGGLCGSCGIIGAYQTNNGPFALSTKSKIGFSVFRPITRPSSPWRPLVVMPAVKPALAKWPSQNLPVWKLSYPAFAEQARQRRAVLDEREHGIARDAVGRVVAADAVLVGELSGQHRRQAGPAQRRRHVAVGKQRPILGKLVQVRRADVGMAHEAEIGPAPVVADDQEDVGLLGGGGKARVAPARRGNAQLHSDFP